MATTTGGSTYVTSTDLVANYPTASLALANRVDLVASGEIVYNTGNYTITVADILGGKTIIQDSASATTVTLPSSSLVNGMQAKISNVGAGTVTVSGGTLLGTATINQYGGITAVYKTSITSWWLLPFSGSVGAANFTNTATGTYTGYKYLTMTGNTSLVIDRAGFADILIVAGGGGGGSGEGGGGGAGGVIEYNSFYLAVGTYTCTIGGGGSGATLDLAGSIGTYSRINSLVAIGGGGGAGFGVASLATAGGSGGGDSGNTGSSQALGVDGQGKSGGGPSSDQGSGGGGYTTAGTASSGINGGAGGTGLTSSITGTSVGYAGGGGGATNTGGGSGGTATQGGGAGGNTVSGNGVAGTINRGGGGGAAASNTTTGGAGGSGVIIIRVAV